MGGDVGGAGLRGGGVPSVLLCGSPPNRPVNMTNAIGSGSRRRASMCPSPQSIGMQLHRGIRLTQTVNQDDA
jgi:hypothetical protein